MRNITAILGRFLKAPFGTLLGPGSFPTMCSAMTLVTSVGFVRKRSLTNAKANHSWLICIAQLDPSASVVPKQVGIKILGCLPRLKLSQNLSRLNHLDLARMGSDLGYSWPFRYLAYGLVLKI